MIGNREYMVNLQAQIDKNQEILDRFARKGIEYKHMSRTDKRTYSVAKFCVDKDTTTLENYQQALGELS